jgi:hypothetical protein
MICTVLAPLHAALPKIAGASAGVRDPLPDASFGSQATPCLVRVKQLLTWCARQDSNPLPAA